MRPLAFHLSLLLLCVPLAAEEDLQLRNDAQRNQLLVLSTGRVVRGIMTPRNGGYDVTLPTGRMFIASEQIRFRANNMDEAYHRMRGSLQELTPNTHLELARWCVTNKLPTYASREIKDALHLDPYNNTARRMLEALVRAETRQQTMNSVQETQAATYDGPKRRSLGGLPQDLALEFSRVIQPVLSNKCGNARCHGAGLNDFSIVSLRRATGGATSQQNLAAVLDQINPDAPKSSPLLTALESHHGGSRQPLFPGRSGRHQMESLRTWVAGVSSELNRTAATSPVSNDPASTVTAPRAMDTDSSKITMVSHKEHLPEHVHDDKFHNEAVQATRIDRFSPTEFNRRYHGIDTAP